jgi:predicted alpha/beta hydrolase family esterase
MARQAIVVPRWGGTPAHDWYPWIVAERPGEVRVLELPDPDTPTIDAWPEAIAAVLRERGDSLADTVVVGHSVGCQAVLRALGRLSDDAHVHAVLCVAGWWSVDAPWATIRPWMDPPPDLERVRRIAGSVHVLLSTNDPFTADYEHNARLWREYLDADVAVIDAAKHFNATEEPSVLDALDRLLDG